MGSILRETTGKVITVKKDKDKNRVHVTMYEEGNGESTKVKYIFPAERVQEFPDKPLAENAGVKITHDLSGPFKLIVTQKEHSRGE